MSLRVMGLCAGIGGLELGLSQVEDVCPVCFVERNPYGVSVLRRRWPEAELLSDIFLPRCLNIDADIITAGFPCQPWSVAGSQKGLSDDRWIFPRIGEIIREIQPLYVFLENVPALISGGGLTPVLGTLATLGYDAAWGVFSCRSLGASHKRDRVFILGRNREPADAGGDSGIGKSEPWARITFPPKPADFGGESELADSEGARLQARRAEGEGLSGSFERLPRLWPPGRDFKKWESIPERLLPSEFSFRRVANGVPGKPQQPVYAHRIAALGNAVSPPVAAVAWRVLKRRLTCQLQATPKGCAK